jgi:hypothetical protein
MDDRTIPIFSLIFWPAFTALEETYLERNVESTAMMKWGDEECGPRAGRRR